MELPSSFDLGIAAGRDLGRVEERERIAAIMALPEALRLSGPAARIALETGLAVPDARRVLVELDAPASRKARTAR